MVRVKNRYIVVQIVPEVDAGKITFNDSVLSRCVMKNVGKYYGEFGIGSTENGFRVKYCNDKTRIAVIRVRHRPHRFVSSILPLICVIGDHKAKFRTLYTGATIMQCNKFIVKHQRDILDKTVGSIESAKERNDFMKNIMEFSVD